MSRPPRDKHDPEASGGIVRRLLPWERDFTQISNDWLRDRRLSFRARGILGYLMTHDVGFRVTLKYLAEESAANGDGEGIKGIRAAVGELESIGYLLRRPTAKPGRFTADLWEIVDPTGLHDPALFGLAGVVDKSAVRRMPSGDTDDDRVPSGHAYRVPSGHDIRTQARTRAERAPSARSGKTATRSDLWKTRLVEGACHGGREHVWPSMRAARSTADATGGLVDCLSGCGAQVAFALFELRAAEGGDQ